MNKILSFLLCVSFFNLMLSPVALADIDMQNSDVQNDSSVEAVTDDSPEATDSQIFDSEVLNDQKLGAPVAEQSESQKIEHLLLGKNNSKKISVESVYISSHDIVIPAQDILQIAFVNDFNGRKAHVGDSVEFRFPNDIITQEGTIIIPSTAKIIAEITKLKRPKPLHMSGKVYLDFKYLQLEDGTRKPIEAKLCGKKDFLSRKTLNSSETVGETVAATSAGTVAGAYIGISASNVFTIIFGGTFGAGIGALAGLAVGIILPGASFKAKAGQRVNIELTNELDI